ncbi:peptidase [Halobacillus andaensis]|uniref:Peptidase n=1 Tax=Halobacillus andaensis TaxID=1176239 RepID=A0A917B703_HALAA|nr:prolyl oligopeptidase family serine peptidase [Halobacillus andaensis]MBP2005674.1 dipeptidyl aminopeptidase/acylaminoacyl peptidase [Halobacillus andaensis]GGF26864.1 peptidase [Halobacillus andaensis]
MYKFCLRILTLLFLVMGAGCSESSSHEPYILSNEKIEIPETSHSKTTEAYQLNYRSDGLEVSGFVVKPKEINEDLPLLIFNRGGNQEYSKIDERMLSGYLSYWANKGYVVLASQYRGNDRGEGKEEFGGADINDVLNLTHVAEELEDVDTNNKVMLGTSRGGMMTYLALKEEMDIQAAAVVSGISDLFLFYEEREAAMKRGLAEWVGDPDTEKEEYEKRSASYWSEKLSSPLFILHGDEDEKVSVEHSRKLADQLEPRSQDFKYKEYEGGGHGLTNYAEEYTEEVDDWFKRYIN